MKLLYAFLLLSCSGLISYAQKLPDVQSAALLAPATVRIDGKNLEWNNFSAENKRTALLYTIANDDKNLYLAIKAANADAITKIFAGGISFSINTRGKKKEEDAFTITYPFFVRNNAARAGQGGGQNRQRMGQNRTEQTQEQRDSLAYEQKKTQLAGIKEIKIQGFNNIPDSLISIYNEYGIKAVAKMDDQKTYFYEVAIPLSILEIADKKEIAYQIKLNGRQNGGGNFTMRTNAGGGGFGGGNNRGGFGGGNNNMAQQDLMVATDFWGKYVIQK